MMKLVLAAAAVLMLAAGPAYAYHCPSDMAKIDQALAAGLEISATDLAKVQELRAEGEALHNAGQHRESIDTLAEAMEILGID